jgi:hypothetical protein
VKQNSTQKSETAGKPVLTVDPARTSTPVVRFQITLIFLALLLAGRLAVFTPFNGHPDEYLHVNAFVYFQNHWWPPDLGSDEVIYSRSGWSRVYNGEIVYLVFGKIGHAAQWVFGVQDNPYLLYRSFNLVLFALTLCALFHMQTKWLSLRVIPYVLLCIPQVYYIHAYANSDAWGLSVGVFLFLLAAGMAREQARNWTWKQFLLLGMLTGLTAASKTGFVLCLIVPLVLVTKAVTDAVMRRDLPGTTRLFCRLGAALLIATLIFSPLGIVYPALQGNSKEKVEAMKELKAYEGFKPSDPSFPFYRLSQKGETYSGMLIGKEWVLISLKSFYGVYGYMTIFQPRWIYKIAAWVALFSLGMTLFSAIKNRGRLESVLKICLWLSPLILGANLFGSIYHSMHMDFQAQGRYLFPSLIPFSLLMAGTFYLEELWIRRIRLGMFLVLYLMALYSLIVVASSEYAVIF